MEFAKNKHFLRNYFLISFLILILIFFNACQPDEEDDVITDARDKLVSAWKCKENSQAFGEQNYYVDITKDTLSNYILIDNFFNLGYGKKLRAKLSGSILYINNQSISGYLFNGQGIVSSNYSSINWNYTFDEGNGPENVTAIYTKM
ncbi:MAG: hypothetical protein N3A01_01615 [Bacteroidales bacterium]|nr:hypothetical protein [Bacteroidales bacterium]